MRIVFTAVVFAFLAIEARRAGRNERAQRRRGGVEPSRDVYRWMKLAYPGAFLAMALEGLLRDGLAGSVPVAGWMLFAASKALKWWAIVTLGPAWTFRVIVVPGMPRVVRGPYRFVRHPNYVAVIGELVAMGVAAGARVSGPIATVIFAALIARRITVEEEALLATAAAGRSDV
jgi:methyltransferase